MLDLFLKRAVSSQETTLGVLFNRTSGLSEKVCVTLEDEVRVDNPSTPANEGAKVQDRTAIPAGVYFLEYTWSPKFGKFMIGVKDVTGFTGIRIHSGNTAVDTRGCILVGHTVDSATRIHGGTSVLPMVVKLVTDALTRGEEVRLTIENGG